MEISGEGAKRSTSSDCRKSIIILYEGLNKVGHSYLAMKFQELSRTFQGVFQEIFRELHRSSMLIRLFIFDLYKHDLFQLSVESTE